MVDIRAKAILHSLQNLQYAKPGLRVIQSCMITHLLCYRVIVSRVNAIAIKKIPQRVRLSLCEMTPQGKAAAAVPAARTERIVINSRAKVACACEQI